MPSIITLDGARRSGKVKSLILHDQDSAGSQRFYGARTRQTARGFMRFFQRPTFISGALGDEWSDDASPGGGGSILGDAAYSFLSWGIFAFALGTAGIRLWHGFKPHAQRVLKGPRRRRRRR